jgi:hypothetical protein
MAPDQSAEREWIRSRIRHLRDLLAFVTDDRVIEAMERLIADAEAGLLPPFNGSMATKSPAGEGGAEYEESQATKLRTG